MRNNSKRKSKRKPSKNNSTSIIIISMITIAIISILTISIIAPNLENSKDDTSHITILRGSSFQGALDYSPDVSRVPHQNTIIWYNADNQPHTVTSSPYTSETIQNIKANLGGYGNVNPTFYDTGELFDSGIIPAGESYTLSTTLTLPGKYEYFCLVHPWMTSHIIIS